MKRRFSQWFLVILLSASVVGLFWWPLHYVGSLREQVGSFRQQHKYDLAKNAQLTERIKNLQEQLTLNSLPIECGGEVTLFNGPDAALQPNSLIKNVTFYLAGGRLIADHAIFQDVVITAEISSKQKGKRK